MISGATASLFNQGARREAIDQLHNATAIYTAEPVVDALLQGLAWPHGSRKLVDPSCGDGAFLHKALLRLLAAEPLASDQRIIDVLEGWELHEHACEQSRARVARILVSHGRTEVVARWVAELLVRNADFLTQGPTDRRYYAAAGNPPYIRFGKIPELLRDDYRDVVPGYATGDLLFSFLDRCARTITEDGEIRFVTADRWLFNQGAMALRESLGKELGILHLERLDPQSSFYRPKQRRAGTAPRIHPVWVRLGPMKEGAQRLSSAPVYPDTDDQVYAGFRTLGECCNGSNCALVGQSWNLCRYRGAGGRHASGMLGAGCRYGRYRERNAEDPDAVCLAHHTG